MNVKKRLDGKVAIVTGAQSNARLPTKQVL